MTDTPRDARVTAWHSEITRKLDTLRTGWAEAETARAAGPAIARRNPAASRRRHTAGPPDAAARARQADEARQLAEARAGWLIAMERAAIDIARMGMD
ncbi:hypothetical protein [Caulobacter henricii]|uniref:Uncharacterized protein n=1 Tax=Caulobacter henricii TaxID=69395 RepID=A0A0P0P1L4_9CAUL|nr:hypothetical protein [Caulobacter henricii]ALL14427.1 hypothetical protein AQ619_14335 [Caulobacter henricii]